MAGLIGVSSFIVGQKKVSDSVYVNELGRREAQCDSDSDEKQHAIAAAAHDAVRQTRARVGRSTGSGYYRRTAADLPH